jgi:hypothetical protein
MDPRVISASTRVFDALWRRLEGWGGACPHASRRRAIAGLKPRLNALEARLLSMRGGEGGPAKGATRMIFAINSNLQEVLRWERVSRRAAALVIAGLDPAIHPLRKNVFAKNDGPAGHKRVYARLRRAQARG